MSKNTNAKNANKVSSKDNCFNSTPSSLIQTWTSNMLVNIVISVFSIQNNWEIMQKFINPKPTSKCHENLCLLLKFIRVTRYFLSKIGVKNVIKLLKNGLFWGAIKRAYIEKFINVFLVIKSFQAQWLWKLIWKLMVKIATFIAVQNQTATNGISRRAISRLIYSLIMTVLDLIVTFPTVQLDSALEAPKNVI